MHWCTMQFVMHTLLIGPLLLGSCGRLHCYSIEISKPEKKVTGDLFLHKNGRTELQWNWIMLKSIWMKIYFKILLIAVCFFVSVHSLVYSVIIFHSQHTHCQLQVLFWHNINVWIFICSLLLMRIKPMHKSWNTHVRMAQSGITLDL